MNNETSFQLPTSLSTSFAKADELRSNKVTAGPRRMPANLRLVYSIRSKVTVAMYGLPL